jgi:hypothetical protein
MRRKPLPPDTRLRWDDPEMPVVREYRMADGSKRTFVDPEYERRYREHRMATGAEDIWRNDRTYNMRKK